MLSWINYVQMPQMKLGFTIDPQQHWWPNNQQQKNVRTTYRGTTAYRGQSLESWKKTRQKNELSQKAEILQNHNVQCVAIAAWHGTRSAQWANHKNNVSESCLQVVSKPQVIYNPYCCNGVHNVNGSSTYRGPKFHPSCLTVSYYIHTIFPYFMKIKTQHNIDNKTKVVFTINFWMQYLKTKRILYEW